MSSTKRKKLDKIDILFLNLDFESSDDNYIYTGELEKMRDLGMITIIKISILERQDRIRLGQYNTIFKFTQFGYNTVIDIDPDTNTKPNKEYTAIVYGFIGNLV